MKKIALAEYEILFDDSLESLNLFIQKNSYSKVFVLVDENTILCCLEKLISIYNTVEIIEIESGEKNKNILSCEIIWQQLISQNADRKALFINLGGGVVGDMGGFAASCYKRGIDFINIPTTLLSQVDSSIGGKLGIDFRYGKNLIGLFRNPKQVIISSYFFKTLPQRHFVNGWSEIFKHALIKDKKQWLLYLTVDIFNCDMSEIIYQSLQIKKAVIVADPFEKNERKILNFGHTIGHALEAYSLENEPNNMLHGEAIAIGMICESYLSVKKCGLRTDELKEIQHLLLKYFPKRDISNFPISSLLTSMHIDKKNADNKILAALLKEIGNCLYDIELSKEEIIESIEYYIQL